MAAAIVITAAAISITAATAAAIYIVLWYDCYCYRRYRCYGDAIGPTPVRVQAGAARC